MTCLNSMLLWNTCEAGHENKIWILAKPYSASNGNIGSKFWHWKFGMLWIKTQICSLLCSLGKYFCGSSVISPGGLVSVIFCTETETFSFKKWKESIKVWENLLIPDDLIFCQHLLWHMTNGILAALPFWKWLTDGHFFKRKRQKFGYLLKSFIFEGGGAEWIPSKIIYEETLMEIFICWKIKALHVSFLSILTSTNYTFPNFN